jgi:hypothetical protein
MAPGSLIVWAGISLAVSSLADRCKSDRATLLSRDTRVLGRLGRMASNSAGIDGEQCSNAHCDPPIESNAVCTTLRSDHPSVNVVHR